MLSQLVKGLVDGRPFGVVSVTEFGAKGDGVSDETIAIQNAIDNGRAVIIPPGNYLVTDTITLRWDSMLLGAGNRATTLTLRGENAKLLIPGANRVVIRDLFIRTDDYSARYGIYFQQGSHHCLVENVDIRGFAKNGSWETYTGAGIYFEQNCWVNWLRRVNSSECFIGIYVNGSNFNGCAFYDTETSGNTQDGIYLNAPASHGITLMNGLAQGNGRVGVHLYRVFQANVVGYFVEHNTDAGILINGTSEDPAQEVNIIGSTFYSNGANAGAASLRANRVLRVLVAGCRFAGPHSPQQGAVSITPNSITPYTKKAVLIENYFHSDIGAPEITGIDYCYVIDSRRQGGNSRPSNPSRYECFFDSTLGKPIWYRGDTWVDSTGTPV